MRPMPSLALQPPYEESKHQYTGRYTKSCKQVKIINQNHILGQNHGSISGSIDDLIAHIGLCFIQLLC